MKRLGSYLLLTLCIVSLLAAPMFAQKTTGTLRGVVTDPSGAVLSNVAVTISQAETGQARTVTTNSQGEYVAAELAVGVYMVTVKAPNFKESISNNVDVHTSSTQTLNIQLQVGSASEQVTVAATEVQVQTDSAALGDVVTGEQVRELPLNGRSFVQLTQLQPGVSFANSYDSKNKGLLSGVDFSVNGNSNTNNLFMVDGANDNDVGSNRTILIYPSIEAISEFKMLRNSFGAEYGQASAQSSTSLPRAAPTSGMAMRCTLAVTRSERLRLFCARRNRCQGSGQRPCPITESRLSSAMTTDFQSAVRLRRTNCSSSTARSGTLSAAEPVKLASQRC